MLCLEQTPLYDNLPACMLCLIPKRTCACHRWPSSSVKVCGAPARSRNGRRCASKPSTSMCSAASAACGAAAAWEGLKS